MPKRSAYADNRAPSILFSLLAPGVGSYFVTNGSPAVVPLNEPTIGTPTITAQIANIVTIRWPITMAATGAVATRLEVDVFSATDTAFATPLAAQQVFTTGIGLSAALNVSFAGLNGFAGAAPISFVIRAVAT
jgi:hypothetical protein